MRLFVDEQGRIVLPDGILKAFGFIPGMEVIAEVTEHGVLLRSATEVPFEVYTNERIAEFVSDAPEIRALLRQLEP